MKPTVYRSSHGSRVVAAARSLNALHGLYEIVVDGRSYLVNVVAGRPTTIRRKAALRVVPVSTMVRVVALFVIVNWLGEYAGLVLR